MTCHLTDTNVTQTHNLLNSSVPRSIPMRAEEVFFSLVDLNPSSICRLLKITLPKIVLPYLGRHKRELLRLPVLRQIQSLRG